MTESKQTLKLLESILYNIQGVLNEVASEIRDVDKGKHSNLAELREDLYTFLPSLKRRNNK